MFDKIRGFLNIKSLSEKLDELKDIEKSLDCNRASLDELSRNYVFETNKYNSSSNCDSETAVTRISENYKKFLKSYDVDLSKSIKEKLSLEKQREKLIKDSKLNELVKSIESDRKSLKSLKKAVKDEFIDVDQYLDIIRQRQGGKVKYADNIVINEEGKILLLKRSIWEDQFQGAWVVPGGHVDEGEDFEEAAIRELKEESGLTSTNARLKGTYEDDKCIIHYYLSEINIKEQPLLLDFKETVDYVWVSFRDLDDYKMVFNMQENIKKILGITDENKYITRIKKALEDGILSEDEVLEKAKNLNKDKVGEVMGEFKRGTLYSSGGDKVTDKKQAVAIAMSEAGISKSNEDYSPEHLKDMIKHREHLLEVLSPHAEVDEKVADEVEKLKEELKRLKKEHALSNIEKSFEDGIIDEDVLEKARVGVYDDTPENRRLKRVGQKYGSKKQEEAPEGKQPKKEEQPTDKKPANLEDQAKNASGSALEQAAKEAKDPEVRTAAHKELARREKEETAQPEEKKEGKSKIIQKESFDDIFNLIEETKKFLKERGYKDRDIYIDPENVGRERRSPEELKKDLGSPIQMELISKNRNRLPDGAYNLLRDIGGTEIRKRFNESPEKEIDPLKINTEQEFVFENILKSTSNNLPQIIKYKDNYYVYDGNHRLTKSLLNKDKKLSIKLIDFDKNEKENREGNIKEGNGDSKGDVNPFIQQFESYSDEQLNFYLKAPNEQIKNAAKELLKNRGLGSNLSFDTDNDFKEYFDSYDKDLLSLSPAELGSLITYKDMGDTLINRKLRTGEGVNDDEDILNINKAFDNFEGIKDDLDLYRGMLVSGELKKSFEKLEVGGVFSDKAYNSTSLDNKAIKSFSENFMSNENQLSIELNIKAKKGQKAIPMQNIGDENQRDYYKEEKEFLLPSSTKYKVLNKEKSGNSYKLTVEII